MAIEDVYPFTGWLLPPMIASVAMSLSSASVDFNTLRLQRAQIGNGQKLEADKKVIFNSVLRQRALLLLRYYLEGEKESQNRLHPVSLPNSLSL